MYKDISLPTAQLLAVYVGDLPDNQNVLGIILQHCRNDAVFAAQPHWLFVVRDILRPVVQRASASLSKLIGSKEKDIAVPVKRTTRAAPTDLTCAPTLQLRTSTSVSRTRASSPAAPSQPVLDVAQHA